MGILENYKSYFDTALDFVFPPLCAGCDSYNDNNRLVCDRCLDRIEYCEQPFCLKCRSLLSDKLECFDCKNQSPVLFAITHYNDPMPEIVKQFKFKNIVGISELIASHLSEKFIEMIEKLKIDCLIPIPLSAFRENKRGYNQAELFALEISKILKLEIKNDMIVRTKNRHPQARLKISERSKNIRNVFKIINSPDRPLTAALVDDVVTSGLTTLEAVKILNQNNIKVPAVVSMAQAF